MPINVRQTRLISRNRVYTPEDLRYRLTMVVVEPAAFLMTRKMLLGIKRRAERLAPIRRQAA